MTAEPAGAQPPLNYTEDAVKTADGLELFVRCFSAGKLPAPRTMLLVHGAGGYGGRYREFALAAVARGWRVLLPDLRGHGRSEGFPVHVRRFEEYLQDLDQVADRYELQPGRTAILGQSMGGLVAARYAETRPERLSALVLLCPLLRLAMPVNPVKLLIGKALAYLAPRTQFRSGIDPRQLSRDPARQEVTRNDPLLQRRVTARWFAAMERELKSVWLDRRRLTTPCLVLQGSEDQIVDPAAPAKWCPGVASSDLTLEMLPGHVHELLHEPDAPILAARILDWLDARLPEHSR